MNSARNLRKITAAIALIGVAVAVLVAGDRTFENDETGRTSGDLTAQDGAENLRGARDIAADSVRRTDDLVPAMRPVVPPLPRAIDWTSMPRGLGSFASESLEMHKGEDAYKAAVALGECQSVGVRSEALLHAVQTQSDQSVRRILQQQYEEVGRIVARCQTVGGNIDELRLKLLDLASAQRVVGATGDLISLSGRNPTNEQWQALAADAASGDVLSLAQIVALAGADSNLSGERAKAYRLAIGYLLNDVDYVKYSASVASLVNVLYASNGGAVSTATRGTDLVVVKPGTVPTYSLTSTSENVVDAASEDLARKIVVNVKKKCCSLSTGS